MVIANYKPTEIEFKTTQKKITVITYNFTIYHPEKPTTLQHFINNNFTFD